MTLGLSLWHMWTVAVLDYHVLFERPQWVNSLFLNSKIFFFSVSRMSSTMDQPNLIRYSFQHIKARVFSWHINKTFWVMKRPILLTHNIISFGNFSERGILLSPDNDGWEPLEPEGSFYKTIVSELNKNLERFGDWNFLNNCINNTVFRASQFEPTAKK